MLTVSESAQKEFKKIIAQEAQVKGIRLGVKGGGCSGYSYVMKFETDPREDDQVVQVGEVSIFIDPKSWTLLEGLEIDYVSDILNGGFKFKNPNATVSCGCGTSFAV